MFRNHICISTKYKIDAWYRVIYNLVGLSTICEYPADDVMSFSHQFELQSLNFLGKSEQIGSLLFILLRKVNQNLCRNFQIPHDFDMGNDTYRLKTFFTLWENFCY